MKLNHKGLLIVLSGPSGVGKGTVRKALFERVTHNIEYSISMTTRQIRPGEVDGKDYYFVTEEEFLHQIEKGNLLEYARFVGNYYGTPLDKIEKMLDEGNEVLLEIEVQGAMQVKEKMPDAVFIFLAPPSFDALTTRLNRRGTECKEIIKERVDKAAREIDLAGNYDYIVINDEIENAVDKILSIIRAEHARCNRSLAGYLELIQGGQNND